MAANSGGNQPRRGAGRPFKPGQSGNPKGKPPGTRHQLTLLAEGLMSKDVAGVVRRVVKSAREGDMVAAKLILDRLSPVRKGRLIAITMPPIATASDVAVALSQIIASVAVGELTPDEAGTIASLIELKRKAIETVELESRLQEIESRVSENEKKR